MAVDVFLKIEDPEVKGESLDKEYADHIQILAWSWGMSQSGTTHMGSGGGAGKVNVQDISMTKWVDKASPNLMAHCCAGKHFKKATLFCRKAGGDQPLTYLVIEMKDVLVSSLSTGGSGGEDRFTENVTLNFADFKVSYQEQGPDGGKKGGTIDATWNIVKNAAA